MKRIVAIAALIWSVCLIGPQTSTANQPQKKVELSAKSNEKREKGEAKSPSSQKSKPTSQNHQKKRAPKETALTPIEKGRALYIRNCSSCHHPQRIGRIAPPLLPLFLKKLSDQKLKKILFEGNPGSTMPKFRFSEREFDSLSKFLRSPAPAIAWGRDQIEGSMRALFPQKKKNAPQTKRVLSKANFPINWRNLLVAVEKGRGRVLLIERDKVLARFPFGDVHGGVKFSPKYKMFFVPARTGWIGQFSWQNRKPLRKVRACVYLRNIAISRDGEHLSAACWLPKQVLLFRARDLKLLKVYPLKNRPSAVYSLYRSNKVIFTLLNSPKLGIVNLSNKKVYYLKLHNPIENFILDPLELYLIGTSKSDRTIRVISLATGGEVFRAQLASLPHLFAAATWYRRGKFFLATSHLRPPMLSIWQLYQWKLVRKVPLKRAGFFVRTHPQTPYLWVDTLSPHLVLVDKETLRPKSWRVAKGKLKVFHTEFSGDGELAYLSLLAPAPLGKILIFDSVTLAKRGEIPVSLPLGKYNPINKMPRFKAALLGKEVFFARCWGCHHPTEEAFGPPFIEISNKRTDSEIIAQLSNPQTFAKHLGYKRNAMPRIPLSAEEIQSLLIYIRSIKFLTEHNSKEEEKTHQFDR